jgi:hypothetical protein
MTCLYIHISQVAVSRQRYSVRPWKLLSVAGYAADRFDPLQEIEERRLYTNALCSPCFYLLGRWQALPEVPLETARTWPLAAANT